MTQRVRYDSSRYCDTYEGADVPSASEWRDMIAVAMSNRLDPVDAHVYRCIQFSSHSSPLVMGCRDGRDYVVKGLRRPDLARALVNDHVMGILGREMHAPVPAVSLVNIPAALDQRSAGAQALPAGVAHGSHYMPDASKVREGIKNFDIAINRPRFAILAIMYGWAGVQSDHQFFYQDGTNAVYSFDHGHFFPNGPNWTPSGLKSAPAAVPDPVITKKCGLRGVGLDAAKENLRLISDATIARAVGAPPDQWLISMEYRVALAMYLDARRLNLLS